MKIKLILLPPSNLVIKAGEFQSLMKIKLMFYPHNYNILIIGGLRILSLHGDKVDVICKSNVYCSTEATAKFLIPHEDKVDVITPVNILDIGEWRILIPHEDKADVISPSNI